MKKKVYLYQKFERLWHWLQAALILFLAVTGFEIHGSYKLFGFENIVRWHNIAAWSLIVLIVLSIFWHFTTDAWKQYIPTLKNLRKQIEYYLKGIFKNAPHPVKKSVQSKLNPLQRIVYLGLNVILIPATIISGLFYLYYRFPQSGEIISIGVEGLETIALIHTICAYLLLMFLIVHIYLITTGHAVFSSLRAMLTGYEDIEDESSDDKIEKDILK